jgi:hypothetical protein
MEICKEKDGIRVGDKVLYNGHKGYVAVIDPTSPALCFLLRLDDNYGYNTVEWWDKEWYPDTEKKENENCRWCEKTEFKVIKQSQEKQEMFEDNKTITELGIDTTRKFFYADEESNGTFEKGDILELERDYGSLSLNFKRIRDGEIGWCRLRRLRYATAEEIANYEQREQQAISVVPEKVESTISSYCAEPVLTSSLPKFNLINNNKIMSTINNVVDFAKNLTLSKEEKLMRKHGLKTANGEYTPEAQTIIINKIMKEREADLVTIAEEIEKEDKKK